MIPDLKVSPFIVAKAPHKPVVRTKHWFRVIYRYSPNGGQKWGSWMRWHPPVDVDSPAFHGQFKTRSAAVAMVNSAQAKHLKSQQKGKTHVNFGGGLVAEMKVEKGAIYQYALIEEVTQTLSEEVL